MRRLLAVVLLSGLVAPAAAQQEIVDQFEVRAMTHEGFTLPYRLFVPVGYDASTAYPLVLALHGAGERGTDNERQIRLHRLATAWADPANQTEYPAFVVAPQVPPGLRWSAEQPVDQSSLTAVERTTLAILDSLAAEFSIDPDRIYLTGLSMGGHGVWDLVSRLPYRFAAAVPMSGRADPTQADRILHLPIWAFHGESDTVVPVSGSRLIIQAMEDLGRDVLYTDCRRAPPTPLNYDCPGTISNSALAQAIDAHADLIYTSVRGGGHGPWTVWYDHPRLFEWVFSKKRVDPDAIALTTPSPGDAWSGVQEVTWTSPRTTADTVEVWLSPDDGATWQPLGEAPLAEGRVALDTGSAPDTPFARIRLFVRTPDGFIVGRTTGAPFTIDNAGDAPPSVFVDDEPLRFSPSIVAPTLSLTVRAADPEGAALATEVFYSIDGGTAFSRIASTVLASSPNPQVIDLDLDALPNTSGARLQITVSDGSNTATATTASFVKATPRLVNDTVEHVQGDGIGTVRLHFVEPNRLTGHRYRITFDDTNPAAKTYSVTDLELSTTVLAEEPLSDGVRESPLFDGVRLVVKDLEEGMPDLEQTGWITGNSTLGVTINGGSTILALREVPQLATENDYELTLAADVVDTSLALYAVPAQPLSFTVTARNDGLRRKVLFKDGNKDGRPGSRDVLHILEPDASGDLAPAWEFRFTAAARTVLPEPGDTFLFVPLHRLGAADRFEFVALEGVGIEEAPDQDSPDALSNYPNPFTDHTTVAYRLASPSEVRLEVYDLLGRRTAVLVDRIQAAGEHRVTWTGLDAAGIRMAGGVHFLRLTATPLDGGPSRRLYRSVLRVP